MADNISSLIPIDTGSLADSETLNNNFNYLNNKIINLALNINSVEKITNKGVANGYCPLDSNGSVPNSFLNNISTTINQQISSLSSQIATKAPLSNPTLTGTVKVPLTKLNNVTYTSYGPAIGVESIVKGASGYIKMGNGIIIQWGRQDSGGHSYNKKYSLPTAFSSNKYKVVANLYNTNDSDRVFFVIKTQETSYFYARAQGVEGGSGGTTACQWIAIGY